MLRKELQRMAKEYGLDVLYHNRRWRVVPPTQTDFHGGNGYFVGSIRECLIWLAGYAQGKEHA
jgi:hypothetical protein